MDIWARQPHREKIQKGYGCGGQKNVGDAYVCLRAEEQLRVASYEHRAKKNGHL
jgi:hypothetical protein